MNGTIDHIGMWTWGGRVYNWQRYLDNMQASGMDSVVLWHYHAPRNAPAIQDYAHARGIRVIWGFNWSWNSPVCINSTDDAMVWRDIVLNLIATEYAPLHPDGICFQVGGTELDAQCRLDCATCRAAYQGGAGPLYMKFAGFIIDAVRRQYPELYLHANIHLGGVHQSYTALQDINPAINLMWEDLPGPGWHIEVPFAYDWSASEHTLTSSTLQMVERMCALRGTAEDVAFIVKGFPCHWGGEDPALLDEFDLKVLATMYQHKWEEAAVYCEQRLPEVLQVFRAIANSSARNKMVLLLVEHGLWELERAYPAVLITEALHNPFLDPTEIIHKARELTAESPAPAPAR